MPCRERACSIFRGIGCHGHRGPEPGAESAVFVDVNPRSVNCVRDNLRKSKLTGSVQQMDAFRFSSSTATRPLT